MIITTTNYSPFEGTSVSTLAAQLFFPRPTASTVLAPFSHTCLHARNVTVAEPLKSFLSSKIPFPPITNTRITSLLTDTTSSTKSSKMSS